MEKAACFFRVEVGCKLDKELVSLNHIVWKPLIPVLPNGQNNQFG